MTISEFESYIQKGLGRAIILLRKEPDKTPFREAVWNHAIRDPRYDRQCNASRGHYIKDLFDCFPDGDTLMSELLRVYGEDKGEKDDRFYYIDNLEDLIKSGVEGAEDALDSLYHILLSELLTLPNPLTNGCDRELDDYLYAASRLYRLNNDVLESLVRDGIKLLQNSDRYGIRDFTEFFDCLGVSNTEKFTEIISALEKENPAIKTVFDNYKKESQKLHSDLDYTKNTDVSKPKDWRETVDYAVQTGKYNIPVSDSLWKNLSENDKAEIARLAEEEPDTKRRIVLLSQLRRHGKEILRSFPRDPSPLIAELEENAHVTFPVFPEKRLILELSRVVSAIRHPAVRDAALRSLSNYTDNPDSIWYSSAVKAWITNYSPEDDRAFEDFVTSITDETILHNIGMDLIDAESLVPESVLLYLYENNPCSNCRSRVFLFLIARYENMTNLPESLASIHEEAKLDCDYGTRILARGQSICDRNKKDGAGVEIFADGLHFLGNTEKEQRQDICLHGKVTMSVNGCLLADDVECCVTASAIRFLRSLSSDHIMGEEEFLFPCCGNMLIPSEDGKSVTVIGCSNGTDLTVATDHSKKQTTITSGTITDFVPFDEYRAAVLAYAKQVLCFLNNSPERLFENDFEKNGYDAFLFEYNDLMKKHALGDVE